MKVYSTEQQRSASAQAQHKVQCALLLDVVVGEGATILQLLARKDQALLVWRDTFLVLHFGLDTLDRVIGLHLEVPNKMTLLNNSRDETRMFIGSGKQNPRCRRKHCALCP